jgi:hypothetical protein
MTHYYAATTTKHFSPKPVGVGYIITSIVMIIWIFSNTMIRHFGDPPNPKQNIQFAANRTPPPLQFRTAKKKKHSRLAVEL